MRTANYKGYTVYEDGRVIGIKGTFLKPGVRAQKKVVNTASGQEYPSCTKAAASTGINENTLRSYLSGHKPNKTQLKYAEL